MSSPCQVPPQCVPLVSTDRTAGRVVEDVGGGRVTLGLVTVSADLTGGHPCVKVTHGMQCQFISPLCESLNVVLLLDLHSWTQLRTNSI